MFLYGFLFTHSRIVSESSFFRDREIIREKFSDVNRKKHKNDMKEKNKKKRRKKIRDKYWRGEFSACFRTFMLMRWSMTGWWRWVGDGVERGANLTSK